VLCNILLDVVSKTAFLWSRMLSLVLRPMRVM
jgi:hypothetical protein